jgi:hypothetical protein
MKAELEKDGTLTITAQTELEGYALGEWQKHYGKGKKDERTMLVVDSTPSPKYEFVSSPAVGSTVGYSFGSLSGYATSAGEEIG